MCFSLCQASYLYFVFICQPAQWHTHQPPEQYSLYEVLACIDAHILVLDANICSFLVVCETRHKIIHSSEGALLLKYKPLPHSNGKCTSQRAENIHTYFNNHWYDN